MSLPELCGNPTTPKFLDFMYALESLCKAHAVTLSVSGYDGLQVWDDREDLGAIYCNGIVDYTKEVVNED